MVTRHLNRKSFFRIRIYSYPNQSTKFTVIVLRKFYAMTMLNFVVVDLYRKDVIKKEALESNDTGVIFLFP